MYTSKKKNLLKNYIAQINGEKENLNWELTLFIYMLELKPQFSPVRWE